MTTRLRAISGLTAKAAACFLLEAQGRRVILDLGRVAGPGGTPDLSGLGPVDAVVLTHMHPDHAAGLGHVPVPGAPPVHATALTAEAIGLAEYRLLPMQGVVEVAGLHLTLGRNGHAPGGVWIHVAAGEGLLYCADLGFRSNAFPLDPPPATATVIFDASFGRDDPAGTDHEAALRAAILSAPHGLVLPAPAWGRAVEIVLAAAAAGVQVAVDAPLRRVIARLASQPEALLPGAADALAALAPAEAETVRPGSSQAVVLSDAMLWKPDTVALVDRWLAAGAGLAFSGHCHPDSPAAAMLRSGTARRLPWPTHPSWVENRALLRQTRARRVIAAFCDPLLWPAMAPDLAPAALEPGPGLDLP